MPWWLQKTKLMKKSILVIASHPDDEVIGCGASIARHVHEGDDVGVITLTNGVASWEGTASGDVINRLNAAKSAMSSLGASW